MLLLPSICNKKVLFIFSTNKVAAEEVLYWVPLEQKVVKDVCGLNSSTSGCEDVCRLNSSTSITSAQIESS